MDFFIKSKGSVSIFLVIILLPMMTIAGVFLDLARTKLAQEVITTSADLALNTTLTAYDKDLKDYFGLLASCQDPSSVINISKDYFAASMVSVGVDVSDAQAYADNVFAAFFGDDDIQDFLQISVDGDVTISPMPNGTMNNPALLKDGIIEFMKYRAPVNGVIDLFEKLTNADVAGQMENVSKETEMIEAREKFYEAEKKLIKQAEKAYKAIKAYESYQSHLGSSIISEDFINSLSKFLMAPNGEGNGSFEEIFKDAHTKMVMNLYNTYTTSGVLCVSLIQQQTIYWADPPTTFSDSSQASAVKIENLLKNMNDAITTYNSAERSLTNAWNNTGSMASTDWPIQYWVKLTDNCKTKMANYVTAAQNVWKAANALENAVDHAKENAMAGFMDVLVSSYVGFPAPNIEGKITLQSAYDALSAYYEGMCVSNKQGCSAYYSINSQIGRLNISENNARLKLGTVEHIFTIRNKMYKYIADLDAAAKLLKTAEAETGKLTALIDQFTQAFDRWETIAFDPELDDSELATKEVPGKPMSGGDRQQITYLKENGLDYMSKESVTELTTRLGNVKTLFEILARDMKAIKYRSTPVVNISDFAAFRKAANLDINRIVVNKGSLEAYAAETFFFSIGVQIQRIEIPEYDSTAPLDDGDAYVVSYRYYPDLQKTVLELYVWLEERFGKGTSGTSIDAGSTGFNVSDESSAEKASDKITQKSENVQDVDTKESTTGHSFSEWTGGELPSQGKNAPDDQTVTARIGEVAKYVSSLFSNFSDTFMRSLVSARDDLYTLDYVMSMFTYDTFDMEGCYNKLDDSAKSGLKASNAESVYSGIMDKWTGSPENKTLTLTPRNQKNNWAYGGEVEYILYGSPSNANNKTSVYARIYMIRYALNLSPVYRFYWDDWTLNIVADTLEAFAHIPAAFTKTIACLAITAAEASADIRTLKVGLPVVLYKSEKTDLICNYQSVFMDNDELNGPNLEGKVALQYSDYLKIFLFLKLLGQEENVIYLRIGDVIQANVAQATNNFGYTLSKANVYYTLTANVLVQPMWSKLLAIDDLGDLTTSKGWRTVSITTTDGY